MLSGQQGLLSRDSPAITAHPSAGADNPVTGNRERHGIGGAGVCNGTNGGRTADGCRYLFICARLAVRDGAERLPHLPLKGRRLHVERQLEPRALSFEVTDDLAYPFLEAAIGGLQALVLRKVALGVSAWVGWSAEWRMTSTIS